MGFAPMDPSISEIKYLGGGTLDIVEVRIPDDYPDPENLVLVIYDRTHDGSTTASPSAADIYNVTVDGTLYTEDVDGDMADDDGILHYTFGTSENGIQLRLHAQDAIGLYNSVTGETYGLFSFGDPYTVSTATGDPFAGQDATVLDTTGQFIGSSLEEQPDGTYTLNTTPDPGESYICFTAGALIMTASGARPIESLRAGDLVVTKDKGLRAIRWIGSRHFDGLGLDRKHLQPVAVRANSFGPGLPSRDLNLSPNHALLHPSWKTSLYFAEPEVLILARHLRPYDGAVAARKEAVTYYHILLDDHELIMADGVWCETLFVSDRSLGMLDDARRAEVFEIFPHLRGDISRYGPKARKVLRPSEAAMI